MEVAAAAASSLSALLRHRLRATVRRCFGNGSGSGGLGMGELMRWRRRAGVGAFRYDPLSYALNFDEGGLREAAGEEEGRGDGGFLRRGFSFSSRLAPAPRAAVEAS